MVNIENTYKVVFPDKTIKELKLKELLTSNKNILFFYPKDNTPGCTTENRDFSELKEEFEKIGCNIIWISKDSVDSHIKFIEKHNLKHPLISDPELILHKELWAYWEKKMYWKTTIWVIRSTFIVDKNWNIIKEYKNVRAKWHAQRILNDCLENEN